MKGLGLRVEGCKPFIGVIGDLGCIRLMGKKMEANNLG